MEWLENLVSILKQFFEKYFIPSLSALLITIIIKYITPADFNILVKLGITWFLLGIFLSVFLLILFIIYICKIIFSKISNTKYEENKNKEKLEKSIKMMKSYMDKLSPKSRNMVKYFIENDNKPLAYHGLTYYYDMNNDGFLINILSTDYIVQDSNKLFKTFDLSNVSFSKGTRIKLYRLPEEDYNLLKYMKENNIEISNFDEY